MGEQPEPGDRFGASLAAAGSLPTGGAASLWVGAPGEDLFATPTRKATTNAGLLTELPTAEGVHARRGDCAAVDTAKPGGAGDS